MALTYARVTQEAQAIQSMANTVGSVLYQIERLLAHNGNQAIDWGAGTTPAYISEDGAGNLTGFTFSRQDVANAIYSLLQVQNALTNQTVAQGDHIGNLNQLAGPFG